MKFTVAAQSTRDGFIGDTKDLTAGVRVGNNGTDVVKVDSNYCMLLTSPRCRITARAFMLI